MSYPPWGSNPPPVPPPAPLVPVSHNGVTASFSAALALLGSLVHIVGAVGSVFSLIRSSVETWQGLTSLIVQVLLVLLLSVGGVLLLVRKPIGQILTASGAGLAVAFFATTLVLAIMDRPFISFLSGGSELIWGSSIALIPSVSTVILVLLPVTTRWVYGAVETPNKRPPTETAPGYPGTYPPPPPRPQPPRY